MTHQDAINIMVLMFAFYIMVLIIGLFVITGIRYLLIAIKDLKDKDDETK